MGTPLVSRVSPLIIGVKLLIRMNPRSRETEKLVIAVGKLDAIGGNVNSHTIWSFSIAGIAMENDPFMDDLSLHAS